MYKLENITETDGRIEVRADGLARITCNLGGEIEFVLQIATEEHAYMVSMVEATIDGVMVHFHRSTAQVSTPHGLVNYITQQLPTFNFDTATIDTLTAAAVNGWRAPSVNLEAINELMS